MQENYTIAKTTSGKNHHKKTQIVRVFLKENGIVFSLGVVQNNKFNNLMKYKLSYKNSKFNFYKTLERLNGYQTKIGDPQELNSMVTRNVTFKGGVRRSTGFSNKSKALILKYIKAFLKKNNIKYRHLSNNPIILMKQLCYPGLQILNDSCENIKTKYCGFLAKNDICKSILKNNGKTSRRLLLNLIISNPEKFYIIAIVVNLINKKYGIDFTIDMMSRSRCRIILEAIHDAMCYGLHKQYTGSNFKKLCLEFENIFNKISKHQLTLMTNHVESMNINDYLRFKNTMVDTLRMIGDRTEPLPAFNSLQDLHDKIMVVRAVPHKSPKIELKNFKYNLDTQKLIDDFVSNFNSSKYYIKFPESNIELKDWGDYMHNCVFSYARLIDINSYLLAGIFSKENNELVYNIGYSLYSYDDTNYLFRQIIISLEQVYGKYNKSLTREQEKELEDCHPSLLLEKREIKI